MSRTPRSLVIQAPPEVTAAVKEHIHATALKTAEGMGAPVEEFWQLFPNFKAAVEALPEAIGLLRVAREIGVTVLDTYAICGHLLPEEVFSRLGHGGSYEGHKDLYNSLHAPITPQDHR